MNDDIKHGLKTNARTVGIGVAALFGVLIVLGVVVSATTPRSQPQGPAVVDWRATAAAKAAIAETYAPTATVRAATREAHATAYAPTQEALDASATAEARLWTPTPTPTPKPTRPAGYEEWRYLDEYSLTGEANRREWGLQPLWAEDATIDASRATRQSRPENVALRRTAEALGAELADAWRALGGRDHCVGLLTRARTQAELDRLNTCLVVEALALTATAIALHID